MTLEAAVALARLTDPLYDWDIDDVLHLARTTAGRIDLLRYEDERIVAWAFAAPSGPDEFEAAIHVHPDARRRGLAAALLDDLRRHAAGARLVGETRSEEGLAFALARSFVVVGHEADVALDLATARPAPAEAPPGVTIVRRADAPGLERAMYGVALEADLDIPADEPRGPGTFDEWFALNLGRPARRPELTFIAREADVVVGYAILHAGPGDRCDHGMTGVARAARGRGIARALKLAQIAAARDAGFRLLVTSNELRNAPIRHLNETLGYQPYSETTFVAETPGGAATRPRA